MIYLTLFLQLRAQPRKPQNKATDVVSSFVSSFISSDESISSVSSDDEQSYHPELQRKQKVDKPEKSTPSTTTTMAAIPTDVPSDHNLNLPPIPNSTDSPVGLTPKTVFPRASTQPDVPGTVLPTSTDEKKDGGICPQVPGRLNRAQTAVKNPEALKRPTSRRRVLAQKDPLKIPPKTRYRTSAQSKTGSSARRRRITTSAQSEAGSSSLAPGNTDHGQISNPISQTTPISPLTQTDNADPETMPNADVSDPATMNDPIIDAPHLPQSGILPSSDQLSSTNTIINTLPLSPSSSLPDANTTVPSSEPIITLTPNLSSTPSNVPEVAVLSPSLPQDHVVTSDDSNGPLDPESGDANRASNPAFVPEVKVKIIQIISDAVQKITTAPQPREPQTITGSGLIDAGEERNNIVEDTIVIPLLPVLPQTEELEYPGKLTSVSGEVGTVVVGTRSAVEKDTEGKGIESEVMNGEHFSTMTPVDTGSEGGNTVEGGKDTEGRSDTIDAPEIMDTTGDLEHNANGTLVRMETFAVEAKPLQSHQKTPAVDILDAADVLLEGRVEVRLATPMNDDTDGVGRALDVGAVEGRSLDSQSFTETPTAPISDSKVAAKSVSSQGGIEGDPRNVETIHEGNSEDNMDVDKVMAQPSQPTPLLSKDGSSLTDALYMVRMKSLHSIQLLQALTHFLRMPSREKQLEVSRTLEDSSADLKSQGRCPVIEHARYPLLADLRLPTEEVLSVDQRLDIVAHTLSVDQRLDILAHAIAHASVTLSKNLYPYRGKELETKVDLLDKSLQQEFEKIQKLSGRSCGEMYEPSKELGTHPVTAFDPNIASTSTETLLRGVETSLPSHNRQFESVKVQTEAEIEVPAPQTLSADATMVDLTIHTPPLPEPPSTPVAKADYQPENNRSVAKTVMSIMRNMADLLECTTQGGSVKSLKGKEKEDTDVEMMPSYLDSPAFATILEEFKSMKEEMRRSQHRSQSEVESIKLSHLMEVEALKDEIRAIESKGKQEIEEVTRQYTQQIRELKSSISLKTEREGEGEGEREKESGSEKLPSLELLELRRRVASLEECSRSDSTSVDMLRSGSRASMTNGHSQNPSISRHPPSHLSTDFEEQPFISPLRAPGQLMRERSMSKPGTPASDGNPFSSRLPEVTDLDESIPLPAKSQRKMHMVNFLRPRTD